MKKEFSIKTNSKEKPNPNFTPPPAYQCECYHTRIKTTYLDPATVAYITGGWPENNGVVETEVGECWGTKCQEECKCEGDKRQCTFYPKVQKQACENTSNKELSLLQVEEAKTLYKFLLLKEMISNKKHLHNNKADKLSNAENQIHEINKNIDRILINIHNYVSYHMGVK